MLLEFLTAFRNQKEFPMKYVDYACAWAVFVIGVA